MELCPDIIELNGIKLQRQLFSTSSHPRTHCENGLSLESTGTYRNEGDGGKPLDKFYRLSNSQVLPNGMVISKLGRTFVESVDLKSRSWFRENIQELMPSDLAKLKVPKPFLFEGYSIKVREVAGDSILGINGVSYNYFHWFTSVLLGLEFLDEVGYLKGRKLIVRPLMPWQRKSLEYAGFIKKFSEIIEVEADELVNVNTVTISCMLERHDLEIPDQFIRLGKRISGRVLDLYGSGCLNLMSHESGIIEKVKSCPSIYLNRRDTTKRPTDSDALWESKFDAFGFNSVSFGEISFEAQVLLCSEVRRLSAIHGAGLTNLIFCAKLEELIEIFPKDMALPAGFLRLYLKLFKRLFSKDSHYYIINCRKNPAFLWKGLAISSKVTVGWKVAQKKDQLSRVGIKYFEYQRKGLFRKIHSYSYLEVFKVRILPNGMVVFRDGSILFESVNRIIRKRLRENFESMDFNYLDSHSLDCLKLSGSNCSPKTPYKVNEISAPSILGLNGVSNHYFHWFTSILVGLKMLDMRKMLKERWLITGILSAWQRESLAWSGFEGKLAGIREIEQDSAYRIPRVIIPPLIECDDFNFPLELFELAEEIHKNVTRAHKCGQLVLSESEQSNFMKAKQCQGLYINRRGKRSRSSAADQIYENEYIEKGYLSVSLGQLSFPAQVILMGQTSAIAGLHGVELTNIIFGRRLKNITEIIPNDMGIHPKSGELYSTLSGAKPGAKIDHHVIRC